MITVKTTCDVDKLQAICKNLGESYVPGAYFVFYEEETEVGFLRIAIEDGAAVVEKIAFLPSVELDDKEFFVRSVFYKLIGAAPVVVKFRGEHKELESFGFVFEDGYMQIISSDINLHNKCKSEH